MDMQYARGMISAVLLSAALLGTGTLVQTHEVQAQINLEIGISAAKAIRAMQNQGYRQIQIVRKGFATVEAEACKDGKRYRVRVADGYRVRNTQELGFCRNTVPVEAIEQNLLKRGYTRIVTENQNEKYVMLACQGNTRVRLVFSRQGQLLQERRVGQCRQELEPNDIRQVLRDQGYNRIKFTDRQLPRYVAEACLDGRRYELAINRFGEVRNRNRIGRCAKPINPAQLSQLLGDKGFDRIEIINDAPPVFTARACNNADRVALEIDRFGTIISRRVVGACRAEIGEEEIVNLLSKEGFRRISVDRNRRGEFEVEACLSGKRKLATLSKYGELLEETDAGDCEARSVKDIHDRLKNRNFDDLVFYVEGCRNGRKIRFTYDQFGDRIGRERLGGC